MNEINDVPEAQGSNPTKEDVKADKIQDSVQGLRQQQEQELLEDLAKFDDRPKPPYYEAQQKSAAQPDADQENIGAENLGSAEIDQAKIQATMQGLRQQQEREFQDDLVKFDHRHKPAGYETQLQSESQPEVAPMSFEMKQEIMRIQSLPVEQRRDAVAAYQTSLRDRLGNTTAAGRDLQYRTRVERNGEGITFLDSDGNEYTVWYTDQ